MPCFFIMFSRRAVAFQFGLVAIFSLFWLKKNKGNSSVVAGACNYGKIFWLLNAINALILNLFLRCDNLGRINLLFMWLSDIYGVLHVSSASQCTSVIQLIQVGVSYNSMSIKYDDMALYLFMKRDDKSFIGVKIVSWG